MKLSNNIYEVVVYDDTYKVWRILNIWTGMVYSMEFENADEAFASIEDGKECVNCTVRATTLTEIGESLDKMRYA